jgi:hypothetical protein
VIIYNYLSRNYIRCKIDGFRVSGAAVVAKDVMKKHRHTELDLKII